MMRPTEYIAPVLAVLLALAVGWMAVSRVRGRQREAPPPSPPDPQLIAPFRK